ncbi:hypothetical protein ACTMTJ_44825 [Phytohabitans sp. LJ34]|uniref:hypothetical protein n=1 Tax=Phytohabitans sp. LJ34 TaxID=3452217 RepID=UPI003F8A6C2E
MGLLFDQADKVASVVGALAAIFGAWVAFRDRSFRRRDPRHRTTDGSSPIWRGMVVAAVGLLIILGAAASMQYRRDADEKPPGPPASTPTPTPAPTPNSTPTGDVRELAVTYPLPGKVGFREVVRVVTPPLPPGTTVVAMVRVAGGSWYPTECVFDDARRTGACTYAQFGANPAASAGKFEIVALALPDGVVRDLVDNQPYRGELDDLGPMRRSKVYEYSR